MSNQLPERASLEHLKNEAKVLKKAQSLPKLADAQLEVARSYGFPSWAKLKSYVVGFGDLRREFFSGIRAGDRDRVSAVISKSPSIVFSHDPDNFGAVPITSAAVRSDFPMIDLLLQAGAGIDDRSDWWAGSFGALDMADESTSKYLLKKGATLTVHAAARLGMAKELKEMIAENPEVVHERGGDGQYPLHFSKTAEIVDILVDAGADVDARCIDHESTAGQWRIKNFEVLKRLVERGSSTEIFMAVALDDPLLIAKHLSEDPKSLTRKVNEPGNPMIHNAPGAPIYIYEIGFVRPLQLAANLGRMHSYEALYEASPPAVRLLAASWRIDRKEALLYKDCVSELSKQDASQVCDAARERRLEALKLMLELGFDVNAQDHEGFAPVHWTGFHGSTDAMKIVLPYKPDLEIKNVYGGNALSTCAYGSLYGWHKDGDFAGCARMLIEAGARPLEKPFGSPEVLSVLSAQRA